MTVTITYFVHGTTTDNENWIATGHANGELSKLGVQQSVDLGNMVDARKFDVIFSSDLKRAIYSAKLAFPGREIIHDKRLRECDYGVYTQKNSDIVEELGIQCIDKPFPSGESYKDVERRIYDFLEFLKKKYKGKHVAIVAHKAPQLALEVILNKKTWKQAFDEDWRKTKAWKPGWEYKI